MDATLNKGESGYLKSSCYPNLPHPQNYQNRPLSRDGKNSCDRTANSRLIFTNRLVDNQETLGSENFPKLSAVWHNAKLVNYAPTENPYRSRIERYEINVFSPSYSLAATSMSSWWRHKNLSSNHQDDSDRSHSTMTLTHHCISYIFLTRQMYWYKST